MKISVRQAIIANVFYELKTLLIVISGYVEIIENGIGQKNRLRDCNCKAHCSHS